LIWQISILAVSLDQMIRALHANQNPPGFHCATHAWFLCKDRADFGNLSPVISVIGWNLQKSAIATKPGKTGQDRAKNREGRTMRLIIEIVAAALLVFCISASSAAFAGGGRSADGLSCAFSVPAKASPAARCAAIRRQCGGKFYANYCSGKMLSAM
jgi:hypothetical protein